MRYIVITLFSLMVLLTSTSFRNHSPINDRVTQPKKALLVLMNPFNEISFSVFYIEERNGILVGTNIDEYPVNGGIYRIEGSSNDKFYHKNIIVL